MTNPPKKFLQKNGVLTLNPEYTAWKQTHGDAPKSKPKSAAPVDKMALEIALIQGTGLVAKESTSLGVPKILVLDTSRYT